MSSANAERDEIPISSEKYTKLPIWKHLYLLPLYILPVFENVQNSLFLVAFVAGAIFLLTLWFPKFRALFSMSKTLEGEEGTHVLHDGNLCRVIDDKVFEHNDSVFVMGQGNARKLVADTNRSFEDFRNWFRDSSDQFVDRSLAKYFLYQNSLNVPPPSTVELFLKEITSPLIVFEVVQLVLLCLDGHPLEGFIGFIICLMNQGLFLCARLASTGLLNGIEHPSITVKLLYSQGIEYNYDVSKSSEKLIPGDVVQIDCSRSVHLPFDGLVLEGSCNVDESILTGETVLQEKCPIPATGTLNEFSVEHGKHIIRCGTKIDRKDSESQLKLFVLHTGFNTLRGRYLKDMQNSKSDFSDGREIYTLMFSILAFTSTVLLYTYIEGRKLGKTHSELSRVAFLTLIKAIPVDIISSLTAIITLTVMRLNSARIRCTNPESIPYAGKLDVCCFDKTGTLTKPGLTMNHERGRGLVYPTENSIEVLRICHTLPPSGDNSMVESEEEKAIRKYLIDTGQYSGDYIVHQTHNFDANRKMMSVVASRDNSDIKFAAVKGAPEKIKTLLTNAPEDYDRVFRECAKDGRVLALAYKELDSDASYGREDVESDLTFAGFAVFDYSLQEGAKEMVRELTGSGHKVIMITGDNPITAEGVAEKLGIPEPRVLNGSNDLRDAIANDDELFFSTNVFTRVTPKDKRDIINKYREKGLVTSMCGDGSNDMIALKAAHVGFAVDPSYGLQREDHASDASFAASFTGNSITGFLDVVKQGRSTLSSKIEQFRNMLLTCAIVTIYGSLRSLKGVRTSKTQQVLNLIPSLLSLVAAFISKPLGRISKKRPTANVINLHVALSIILQVAIHMGSCLLVASKVESIEPTVCSGEFTPSLMNSAMFLLRFGQSISMVMANYIGEPSKRDLFRNKWLFIPLILLLSFIFLFATGFLSRLYSRIGFVDLGDAKWTVCGVISANILLCLAAENICSYLFHSR